MTQKETTVKYKSLAKKTKILNYCWRDGSVVLKIHAALPEDPTHTRGSLQLHVTPTPRETTTSSSVLHRHTYTNMYTYHTQTQLKIKYNEQQLSL